MRRIALFSIKLYQSISSLFPRRCIYFPTCSEYAREAFLRYSFLKALKLTLFRVLRCNPFAKGGFDPLSPAREEHFFHGYCKVKMVSKINGFSNKVK